MDPRDILQKIRKSRSVFVTHGPIIIWQPPCTQRCPMSHPGLVLSISILALLSSSCSKDPEHFIRRAQRYLQRGDAARATLELENAAALQPKSAEIQFQLGLAGLRKGDPRLALAAFRRAIQLNPRHIGAHLQLAKLLSASRSRDALEMAETEAREVLGLRGDDPEALDALGRAEYGLGEKSQAATTLAKSIEIEPGRMDSAITLAQWRLEQNDVAGAEHLLRQAVRISPKSPLAASALAEVLMMAGEKVAARAELERAAGLDPRNETVQVSLAQLDIAEGNDAGAEMILKRLALRGSERVRSLHGAFLIRKGHAEIGIAELMKLHTAFPEDRRLRSVLITALVASHASHQALDILNKALQRNPEDVVALQERAELDLSENRAPEALADVLNVVRLEPDSALAHYTLALVEARQERLAQARDELSAAVHLNPGLLGARVELIRALLKVGDSQAALSVVDAAPSAEAGSIDLATARNWVLWSLGRFTEFRNAVRAELAVQPNNEELLLQLGTIDVYDNRFEDAKHTLETCLAQDPQNVRALEILANAYVRSSQRSLGLERIRQQAQRAPVPAIRVLLARWLIDSGELADAEMALQPALKAAPHDVSVALTLARLHILRNSPWNASRVLVPVVEHHPTNIEARLLLAEVDQTLKHTKAAIEQYRAVLQLDSDNVFALNNLALLLMPENLQEARGLAEHANAVGHGNPAVGRTLALINAELGVQPSASGLTGGLPRSPGAPSRVQARNERNTQQPHVR